MEQIVKEPAYQLDHNGIYYNFYQAKWSDEQMPYSRWLVAESNNEALRFGLTAEQFKVSVDAISEVLTSDKKEKEKLSEVNSLVEWLKVKQQYNLQEDILLMIASVYFYLDGEDDIYDIKLNQRKIELMRSNNDAKVFFCETAYKSIKHLVELSTTDLMSYLETTEAILRLMKPAILLNTKDVL